MHAKIKISAFMLALAMLVSMSDSKVSGMSCDWVHASGADLDPSKQ